MHGEVIVKLIIINTIWLPVHLLWLGAGASLRQMALKPGAQRAISLCDGDDTNGSCCARRTIWTTGAKLNIAS